MANFVQRSFGHGEVHPALSARCDLDFYKAAASTIRNFVIPKQGGAQNRPGTEFVGEAMFSGAVTSNVRLVPFVFSDTDSYTLLFGNQYMQVIRNGAFVTATPKTITAISQANPCVVTCTAHGYSNNDYVYISTTTAGGMKELNALTFLVGNVTADTFRIYYQHTSSAVDSSAFTAYASGGTVAKLYSITTVFSSSELAALDYAQNKDVMVLTHPSHHQQLLTRSGHASWTIADLTIGTTNRPLNLAGVRGAVGSNLARYKVTYVQSTQSGKGRNPNGSESLPGTEPGQIIATITNANPAVVTITAHGYSDGDTVYIDNVAGMTEVNQREFTVAVATTFTPDLPKTIAAISLAGPMVVTSTAHGYSNGDKIAFSVLGMLELNDITYGTVTGVAANTFQVYYYGTTTTINSTAFTAFVSGTVTRQVSSNPTATNSFSLVGVDSTSYGAITFPYLGRAGRTNLTIALAADPTAAAPNALSWSGITSSHDDWASYITRGVLNYVIYKEVGGVYGKIGVSTKTSFNDVGFTPDLTNQPMAYSDLFMFTDGWPSCVAFNDQRLAFGNSNNSPQTIWCSRIADYYNFAARGQILDDDPITFTIAGTNVDPIRHLVPSRVLLCMSQSSEVVAEGIGANTFVPGGVSVHQDAHNGSGTLKPVTVNNSIIFTQKDMRVLRDLFYSFQLNSYDSTDLTSLCAHLFTGQTIVDMAYQKSPNSIIWMVRSDGVLLSCTYVKDQSILAFATHDTHGLVENVCCIPEGDETALYLCVKRTSRYAQVVSGTVSHRFIERMATRVIADPTDISDSIFVDAALTYDGRNTSATTLNYTGSHTAGGAGTLTATANTFIAGDVGNVFCLYGLNSSGDRVCVQCTVTGYTSATQVSVLVDIDVPTTIYGTPTTDWARAVSQVAGLWPLASEEVSVTGDGWVVANPNNDTYGDPLTVSATTGKLTLSSAYAVIHVGFPYVSDLMTCDIDNPQGGTLIAKNKLINGVTAYLYNTREVWAGESLPDDDSKDGLKVMRQHETGELTNQPPALFSEPVTINIKSRWNKGGRVGLRNIDPLPCEIIAISPDFHVGS